MNYTPGRGEKKNRFRREVGVVSSYRSTPESGTTLHILKEKAQWHGWDSRENVETGSHETEGKGKRE